MRKNTIQQIVPVVFSEMNRVLAHGVGGSLVPRSIGKGLFGGQDLDKSTREVVEFVRLGDMPVQ